MKKTSLCTEMQKLLKIDNFCILQKENACCISHPGAQWVFRCSCSGRRYPLWFAGSPVLLGLPESFTSPVRLFMMVASYAENLVFAPISRAFARSLSKSSPVAPDTAATWLIENRNRRLFLQQQCPKSCNCSRGRKELFDILELTLRMR